MAEAFIPTTISEKTIYYYFILPRSSGLPWVLSFAKPGPMGYTTPHKFIFSLNESKSPFLSLATKTLLLGEVNESMWEERTRLPSKLLRTRLPAMLWATEAKEGSREHVGPEMEPEDTQALAQRDYQLRYFTLLVPMGRHVTLEFGQGEALCRTLRHFPAKCAFVRSQVNWCTCAEVGPSEKSFCERLPCPPVFHSLLSKTRLRSHFAQLFTFPSPKRARKVSPLSLLLTISLEVLVEMPSPGPIQIQCLQ